MRITKRQLRRIIKEEKAKLLNEVTPSEREEALRLSAEDTARRGDGVGAIESDAIDMLNDILDDWDNDPDMSGRMEYYNRIVGVTKLLEGP